MSPISWCPRSARHASLFVVAGLLSVSAARAQGIFGGCLEEESPEGLNCTSNDVTFAILGTGIQTNGCVDEGFGFCTPEGAPDPDPNGPPCTLGGAECAAGFECRALDEMSVFLRGQASNTTATTRFDVGLWGATDGDPNGDGARSGECVRTFIASIGSCVGGANMNFPCRFDSECPGSTCNLALANTCPPLDLIGNDALPPPPNPPGPANGPFLEVEGDRCGDLFSGGQAGCDEDMDGQWDPTIIDFANAVTLPCSDLDDSGFVDFQTCASWGQQQDEIALGTCVGGTSPGIPCTADNDCSGGGADCVGRGICIGGALQGEACLTDAFCTGGTCSGEGDLTLCQSAADVFNGTPAKCACEESDSQIPVPNLDLTCALVNRCTQTAGACTTNADCPGGPEDICVTPPATFPPESEVLFRVSYSNPSSCTPDLGQPEHLRCGTGAFIRFDTDDQLPALDPDNGTFLAATDTTPTFPSVPSVAAEEVQWIPNSAFGTAGIIGPNRSGSLLMSYRIGAGTTTGDTINLRARTFWSSNNTFVPGVYQTLQAICPLNVQVTWASLLGLEAYERDGQAIVEWRTSTESNTRGFEIYRLQGGERIALHDGLIPSPMNSGGNAYRVVDAHGYPGESVRYLLIEEDFNGYRRALGPYGATVGAESASSRDLATGLRDDLTSAGPAPIAQRELDRLATAHLEAEAAAGASLEPGSGPLKIAVERDGIAGVDAAALAAAWGKSEAQVRQWIAKGQLRLSSGGEQVAWSPAADAGAIYFYGRAAGDPFSRVSVYWLEATFGDLAEIVSGGLPLPQPGGSFLEHLKLESNAFAATNSARNPNVDYWFWAGILAPDVPSRTFDVTVPDVASDAGVELAVRLYSATDYPVPNEHTAIVRLNGVELGQTSWEDVRFHEASFAVPNGVLLDGANQIEVVGTLAGGAPVSGFFVDSFDLSYQRLYQAQEDALAFRADGADVITVEGFSGADLLVLEVTNPVAPRAVTDTTIESAGDGSFRVSFAPAQAESAYAAARRATLVPPALRADLPSDLKGSDGAEWVVVAPAQLMAGAQSLATHRQHRFSTLVVDIEDVYDEFAFGLATPQALRDFVAYAWANWLQPPQFVVLAGAGTFDYKDHQGLGGNLIPPLMVDTPSGLFASDSAYGDVAGDDGVPEVAIGRIPALTQAELATYITKLRAVERSGGPDWRGSALLVADDADHGGDFAAASDAVAPRLPASYVVDTAYVDEEPASTVRQELIDALNSGVGFVNYLGHGGMTQLAEETLLTVADMGQLTNPRRPAVAAALTCAVGRYEFPGIQSLAEALVLDNGGVVAMWAPSGLSYNVDAARLNFAFVDAAFDSGATLGSGIRDAFDAYQADGYFRHMLYIYNLFGDPAVKLR